jgi:hypothetical protein
MTLVLEILIQLVLGTAFVHFGMLAVLGDREMLPASERLELRRGGEITCGFAALGAGVGMIVGLGLPQAGVAGSALGALVIVVALISYLRSRDPPFGRIYAALALLALVVLVGAVHWPAEPLLPSLPS